MNEYHQDTLELESADMADIGIRKIQSQLVERIWKGTLVIALIGIPLSLLRAYATGWLPLYSLHLAIAFVFIMLFFVRHKLSYLQKGGVLVLIYFSVGLIGLFSLGLLGAGIWWLVISTLLISTLFSKRAGIISMCTTIGLVGLASFCFSMGFLSMPVDANSYITNLSSWGSFLVAAIILPYMIIQEIAAYQRATVKLLSTVEAQAEQIKTMANHDQLTGLLLLNMALDRLKVALNRAKRNGKKAALLFIDLDNFKTINDGYGHDIGDSVLVEIAKRIQSIMRESDSAARIGGDEFLIILDGLENEQQAADIAQRVVDEICSPITCSNVQIKASASVGVGIYPDHAINGESLRKVADKAMYVAKHSGKNRFGIANKHTS